MYSLLAGSGKSPAAVGPGKIVGAYFCEWALYAGKSREMSPELVMQFRLSTVDS